MPPLTIALAVVTAGTLLLTAAALAPPPLTGALASPPPPPSVTDVPRSEASITALGQVANIALPTPPAVVDLARLIYEPGASSTGHALPGPLLLVVESGSLTAHLDGTGQILHGDRLMTTTAGDLVLRAGNGLLLPTATVAAFRNAGIVPVVALAAGVFPASPVQSGLGRIGPARWAADWSPGAIVQPLAGGWLVDTAPGPAAIALRRLSVPAGASLPLTAPGPVDLAVETGALTLLASGGLVWRQPPDGPDQWIAPSSVATLLPSDAAVLQEEAQITLRNDGSGPLLVLVLTVVPTATTAIPPGATPYSADRFREPVASFLRD